MRFFTRLAALAIFCTALLACSSGPSYNPTVYPYEVNQELMDAKKVQTVVIPHVNLGAPSRKYLEKEAPRIDGYLTKYLKEAGFKVLPQREFTQHWNTAVRAFGDPVDPTTGKVNMKTFSQIMTTVRDQMKEANDLDAFIFTDLIEVQIAFSGGLKHVARWDGVSRKPSLQGPGSGVAADFDWNKQASGASMQISIYNMDLQRLFFSRGGIDATEAIDTRSSSGRYVRRRNMLESENHIREGIEISMHPFIESAQWPGNP
ncbi:MAG: hypothetical protein V7746_04860 [Halioglobus sp.]